jgi:hypothetical protein
MIKVFWIIVYPIAKGLDKMLGVHQHERIQHKDFATFLNDDVKYSLKIEILEKYGKTASYIYPLIANIASLIDHDTIK